MNTKIVVLLSLLLSANATQTLSFGRFDSSNKDQFKFNLNSPQYNNPPNGYLTLTLSQGNDAGSVFYLDPVELSNSASFSCAFSFIIDQGAGYDGTGSGADGIVFIVNSVSNNGGSVGGGIGYAGIANSVGIEFDTWFNPENGDETGNHIGIDTNGNIRSLQQKASSDLFNDGRQYYAWVDFNGATKSLEVRYALVPDRPNDAFMSRTVDVATILGKNQVYIGFSAATGGSINRHRIASWTFTNSYEPIATVPTASASVCGNGQVESGEQCDGGSCCTSTCAFAASTTTCRASAGDCDVAETCSGSASSCPADSFAPSSTTCRSSAGACDVAETCTGSSSSCPADSFASSSVVCRAAVNSCDVGETCTGTSSSCPADVVSQSASCFCGRQSQSDDQMEYYCDANGGFYQCLGGAFASQSRGMACAAGTHCGCEFGQACSCGLQKSPCVADGTSQQCSK